MRLDVKGSKITASKDVLNYISIIAEKAYDAYMSEGYTALAKEALEFSVIIYEALKREGLYK